VIDTTIRLGHIGAYHYGWEDAVQTVPRVAGLTIQLANGEPTGDKPDEPERR
jgi:hypothetical protein